MIRSPFSIGLLPFALLFLEPACALGLWGRSSPDDTTRALSALVGFEDVPGEEKQLAVMQGFLFQELSKTDKWRLVEPQKVDAVLREPAFQDAAACTTSCTESLGRRLGVQTLLLPDLDRQDGISHLSIRELSMATGEVLRTANAETDEPLSSSSKRLARLVVGRLVGDPATTSTDSGAITVTSNPSAVIWIDGEEAGKSPLTRQVWPGLHRVSVEPDHGRPADWDRRPPPEPDFEVGTIFVFQASSGGYYRRSEGHPEHPVPWHGATRTSGRSSAQTRGGSHDRGGDDGSAAAIVAGVAVAAVGIGLVAAAASMPDSLWSSTWQDVHVKAADTELVEFRKEPNGDKQAMGAVGIIGLLLGVLLVAMVVASKN